MHITTALFVMTLVAAAPDPGAPAPAPGARGSAPAPDARARASSPEARRSSPPEARRASPPRRSAKPGLSGGAKAEARRFYKQGQRLFEEQRYAEAIEALNKALQRWPRREIHFNLAACYYELKQRLRAAMHLRAYLRDSKHRARERRRLPRPLRRLLRRVGFVVVQVARADLDIWVNGQKRGRGRVEMAAWPGEVAVEIKLGDRTVANKVLRLVSGSVAAWQIDQIVIKDAHPPPPPPRVDRRRVHWAWFVGTAALGLAAAGAAVGLGVKTKDLHDGFESAPTFALRDEGRRYQNATNAMWTVAGLAAASAVVLALFTRWRPVPSERGASTLVVPVVTPTGAAVVGRF